MLNFPGKNISGGIRNPFLSLKVKELYRSYMVAKL